MNAQRQHRVPVPVCLARRALVVPLIASKVKSAILLSTGKPVDFHQEYSGRLVFTGLPADPPDPYMPAFKVEFDSELKVLEEKNQAAWLTGEA